MDCIKLQKRKIKIISLILVVSLFVNLILAVMLCARLTHKAADVKQQTTATASADVGPYDIYTIVATGRRSAWSQTILRVKKPCKICKNSNLRSLSHNLCSAKPKKPYFLTYMIKNCICGKSGTSTVIPKAVLGKFILGC